MLLLFPSDTEDTELILHRSIIRASKLPKANSLINIESFTAEERNDCQLLSRIITLL